MSYRNTILHGIRQVPMIPHAAVQALIALTAPNADFNRVADIIRQDPRLAAAILKRANSVAYGGEGNIDTVEAAITRMGTRATLQVITAQAIKPYAMGALHGYDLPQGDLWRHSVAVACGSELLAELLSLPAPKYVSTAALLIDIGKFAMRHVMGEMMAVVVDKAHEEQIPFEQAEFDVLGIDHAEAGAELLRHWGLPESLITVVRWHHLPEKAPSEYALATEVVHIADQLATSCGLGGGIDGSHYRVSEKALNDLKVTPQVIEQTLCRINERLDALSAVAT